MITLAVLTVMVLNMVLDLLLITDLGMPAHVNVSMADHCFSCDGVKGGITCAKHSACTEGLLGCWLEALAPASLQIDCMSIPHYSDARTCCT